MELAGRFSQENMLLLKRVKETKPQYALSKTERIQNMNKVFTFRGNAVIRGKIVFLVDDVVASGSTFKEAARILKKNGAQEVWGISFAKQSY